VKIYGSEAVVAGTSWCGSSAPSSTRRQTSAWAATFTLYALKDGQVKYTRTIKDAAGGLR